MDEAALQQRAAEIERRGKELYGDAGWSDRVNALHKFGLTGDAMAQVVQQPNAFELLSQASREALCRQASTVTLTPDGNQSKEFDREADAAYSRLRAKEREEWRKMKGRA